MSSINITEKDIQDLKSRISASKLDAGIQGRDADIYVLEICEHYIESLWSCLNNVKE